MPEIVAVEVNDNKDSTTSVIDYNKHSPVHRPSAYETIGFDASNAQHWQFYPLRKYADFGVTRGIHPRKTIRRVTPLLSKMGVTRIGEVTHLDRMRIPNFIAVRPRDIGPGISYYNGKGSTRYQAQASALMEAVERYSGEKCDYPVIICTYEEILKRGPAVNPADIIVPQIQKYEPEMPLEWVQGYDLIKKQPTYTPLNSVICPYVPRQGSALYYASTNGLASGNYLVEALCQALCEIIERDAMAIVYTELRLKPAIERVMAGIRTNIDTNRKAYIYERYPLLSQRGLPRRAAQLVGKIERAGLKVYLRNFTATADIPTIECTIVECQLDGCHKAYGGWGTHPDSRVALIRAITEAAQSRVGCIQGGREDLPEIINATGLFNLDEFFRQSKTQSFNSIQSYETDYVDQDVNLLLNRLKKCGLDKVIAFDLTRPEIDIPVVRVVIPQAETWPAFHLHINRSEFGARVVRLLRKGD